MLRNYVETTDALKRLHTEQNGVVSFEYVIVTACVVAIVGAAFNTAANGPIKDTLISAMNTVTTAVTTPSEVNTAV